MRYNIPATLSFLERILIWALVTFCSTTWLKSPVVNLASARENAASFITSPIRVFVWWEIINISKLQVTKLAQSSWTASKKTLLLFDSNFVVDFMSNFFGINDWHYIQEFLCELTSMIFPKIIRNLTCKASAFFLRSPWPFTAPARRPFINIWALKPQDTSSQKSRKTPKVSCRVLILYIFIQL